MDKELQERILAVYNEEADHPDIETVEEGSWEQDGKYQFCEAIFKHEDEFYCVSQSRSGSYHSDWYYNDPDVYEVTPKEIKTIKWVPVK